VIRWIALSVAVVLVGFGVVLAVQHRKEASVPRLVQQHKAAPNFDVTTLDQKQIAAKSLAGKTYVVNDKITWPVAFDPNGSAGLGFGTTGQPETYVISPTGVAACGGIGPVTDADLEAWLRIVRAGGVCG
jgi:hypothetical protein